MPLATIISQIDALVTNCAPISAIKPLLVTLLEQSETLDSRIQILEFEAQHLVPESDYKELVSELKGVKEDRAALLTQLQDLKRKLAASEQSTLQDPSGIGLQDPLGTFTPRPLPDMLKD